MVQSTEQGRDRESSEIDLTLAESAANGTFTINGGRGSGALPGIMYFACDANADNATFIANGPAFRKGVRLPTFDNVDVYPLLAKLVGVTPQRNDGNLADLAPALAD
jgi:hypothetical protein